MTSYNQAEFGPEKDLTYELGAKTQWFDHHLMVGAAAVYSQYNRIQLNVNEGTSPTFVNAGNAVTEGLELESHAVLSDGIWLNTAVGYMEAHYVYTIPGSSGTPGIALPFGTKLPKTPKWKVAISPEYDYDMANSALLRFLADVTYTSSMFNDAPNTALLRRPAVKMVNLSTQYTSPSGKYDLILGGTNVTNRRYIVAGDNLLAAAGLVFGTYNAPAK
jgi:iron complex outermembrane receptor protein